MQFPDAPRVVYENNPLAEVVCQLRFPRILTIENNVPAEFQRRVRSTLPRLEMQQTISLAVGPGTEPPTAHTSPSYVFSTRDSQFKVTLSPDFLAVSTSQYTEWPDMEAHLRTALEVLEDIYGPAWYNRVGLRYINRIDRPKLGLQDTKWRDLIRSSALGLLGDDRVNEPEVSAAQYVTNHKIEHGFVTIRTGFSNSPDSFVIDNDFYNEGETDAGGPALALLGEFNTLAGRAFQWLTLQRLRDALGIKKG